MLSCLRQEFAVCSEVLFAVIALDIDGYSHKFKIGYKSTIHQLINDRYVVFGLVMKIQIV